MRLAPILTLTAILLLAVTIVPVFGQPIIITASTDKQTYRPGETVVVSGTVTKGGSPYAGATVGLIVYNPKGTIADVNSGKTDSQGRFTINIPLPPTLPYPSPQEPRWIAGTYRVDVSVEGTVTTLTFTLTAGGVVVGRVVDEMGNPVQGATVLALGTTASVTTDASGRFSIETGPGSYTLEISKAGYLRNITKVTLSVGETRDIGNITLLSLDYVISQLQERIANLTAQNQQLMAQLAALQSQFRAAQEALTAALGNISSKLDSLSSDVRNGFSSISSTLSDITSRLAVLDQLRTAVDGLRTDITGLRTDINTLTSGQKDLSSRVDALSSKLDTVSTDLRNSISSAQSSLSSALTSAINSVNSRIDNVSASVGSLTVPVIVAVILALLAFVFALLTFLQVRRAMAAK